MQHLRHLLFTPYRGSNRVSRFLRKKIEAVRVPQIVGINLAGLAFFSAIIAPQVGDVTSALEVENSYNETVVEVVPTDAKFQWPVSRFTITTRFSTTHPAIDLIDPIGTPIYPIADGWVSWTNSLSWGYGKHLLVEHTGGIKSLYAHLLKFDIVPGQSVNKQTKLGEVGATGWATGSHVHLEIYQNGIPINPLEVLPAIK